MKKKVYDANGIQHNEGIGTVALFTILVALFTNPVIDAIKDLGG